MKPTKAINVTGNPTFRYRSRAQTDVVETIKRWLREYREAWDEAHAENAARDKANQTEVAAKVRRIVK